MTKTNSTQMTQPTPTPSDVPAPTQTQALKQLEPLVGDWTTEIVHPTVRPNPIRGRSRFERLTKGSTGSGFLVLYDEVEHPDLSKRRHAHRRRR